METSYTSEMTMLITVSSSVQPAPPRPQMSPPPTLPKPGKDNLRLQKLLKKAAKKNAVLASEQAKPFRSSLSPVNEASPDLEHNSSAAPTQPPKTATGPSISLPSRFPIQPVTHRNPSPLRRSKPFTLTATEQRRIAEHLRLTASPEHKAAETPRQPEGSSTQLPSPRDSSIFIFPQLPSSTTASAERAPEVTYVTKVHTSFHSVKAPKAKTSTSNQTQATCSNEDKRPSSPACETSRSEPSPGQTPALLGDSKTVASPAALEPRPLSPPKAEPPSQAPRPAPHEESVKGPYPKPSTSDAISSKPTTLGSSTEISGSERVSKPPKQHSETPTPSSPWRQAPIEAATPPQAHTTGATPTETRGEHATPPQLTPRTSNTSPSHKAEPTRLLTEGTKPPGASISGWHRLRKHLVVQPEAPSFPEPGPGQQGQEDTSQRKDSSQTTTRQDSPLVKSRATRMWDAVLYQMTVKKKLQAGEKRVWKEEGFSFPRRLPILLHKPRFDARKLKELAAKPMTKITTMFEVGRYGPKVTEERTRSCNQMASGWSVN